MRRMIGLGVFLLLFGFAFLWLTYAIGISGNSDQRPIAYLIILVGVMTLALTWYMSRPR